MDSSEKDELSPANETDPSRTPYVIEVFALEYIFADESKVLNPNGAMYSTVVEPIVMSPLPSGITYDPLAVMYDVSPFCTYLK
jgi:hypothetical protein